MPSQPQQLSRYQRIADDAQRRFPWPCSAADVQRVLESPRHENWGSLTEYIRAHPLAKTGERSS